MNAAQVAKALNARPLSTGGYIAKCIGHDDSNPSMSIADGEKGLLLHCHAGCDGDDLIREARGRGFIEDRSPDQTPLAHGQLGRYSQHWDYYAAGVHVLRVCRWDVNGKKEIRPLSFQGGTWTWKQLADNRPLYQLPALLADKSKRVLLVEGEKTADAAQKYFTDLAVTTWAGGAKAISKTDWRPLAGRDVTLFHDNDEPGRKAMDDVAGILRSHGCTVRRADVSKLGDLPEGWDIADAVGDQSFDLDALWDVVEGASADVATLVPDGTKVDDRSVPDGTHVSIRIRSAADIAADLPRSTWLLRPYIERNAIGILYGDFGTYKSFVVLDWSMRIALGLPALGHSWPAPRAEVLFISAEGRGLAQRLRGWCIRNFPGEDYADVLKRAPVYCVEHPVNLSDPGSALALVESVNAMGITPGLIVIDTMSRNSDGKIEHSTTDAGAYLTIIDQGLRARYGCGVLLTHHVGHVEKGRIRGPIVLAANTDALIRIERSDGEQRIATVTVDRLKDAEPPAPQGLRACIVEIGESDEDGQPITTLALEATEAPVVIAKRKVELRGKAQRQLLTVLRAQPAGTVWTIADLREVARGAGLNKGTARSAAESLTFTPYLTPTVGGWRLSDDQG